MERTAGIVHLEIISCGLGHSGRYTCRAENERGTDDTSCSLVVEGIKLSVLFNLKYF